MKSNGFNKIIKNEDGKLISWAILLIALVASAYSMGANEFLNSHFKREIAIMINVCVAVVCFCMFGCGVSLSNAEKKAKKGDTGFRQQLSTHNQAMLKMVEENEILVKRIENKLASNVIQISAKGMEHLNLARRIINNLTERMLEIKNHIDIGSNKNLIAADQLFRSKLIIVDNPVEAVLDSQAVPPLSINDCKVILERIVTELEIEGKKAAA